MYTVNLGQAVNKSPAQSSTLTPDFSPATTHLLPHLCLFNKQVRHNNMHPSEVT